MKGVGGRGDQDVWCHALLYVGLFSISADIAIGLWQEADLNSLGRSRWGKSGHSSTLQIHSMPREAKGCEMSISQVFHHMARLGLDDRGLIAVNGN